MAKVHNSATIARIIVRELRSGNTFKEPQGVICRSCGWVGARRVNLRKPCPLCLSGRIDHVPAKDPTS